VVAINNKNRKVFLPFSRPDITLAEIEETSDTLRSGWLAKGPKTIEFEKKFAQFVGASYAIGMNSCTAALHIALLSEGIGPEDEVITSPMTFVATANTIIHTGATPVFVDINPQSGCIDCDRIEARITSRTKAIVPVHYGGQACDLDSIYKIAKRHGLYVSEDAAHAICTKYKDNMIGSSPKGSVSFSFYATKNLCTGEGGMLVTDNPQTAEKARMLVTHGMSKNAWKRYGEGGSWLYDVIEPGYKYNMFDLQAGIGLKQLERLESMQKQREKIAEKYNTAFACLDAVEIPYITEYTTTNSWHLYVLRLNLDKLLIDRSRFIEELYDRNIGSSVHFIPVNLMTTYIKKYGFKKGDFPDAESYFERIISLPIYSSMEIDDAFDVITAVTDIIDKYHI